MISLAHSKNRTAADQIFNDIQRRTRVHREKLAALPKGFVPNFSECLPTDSLETTAWIIKAVRKFTIEQARQWTWDTRVKFVVSEVGM